MHSELASEILQRWERLQDVEKERTLFQDYLAKRTAYLEALKKHAAGSLAREDLSRALGEEQKAFDAYVDHRSNPTYRSGTP